MLHSDLRRVMSSEFMKKNISIAVLGTFDSKPEEHLFLKECIKKRDLQVLTINVGAKTPSPFSADIDLFTEISKNRNIDSISRDEVIQKILLRAQELIMELHEKGDICGIISAGGGSGTHLCTAIMHKLPVGVPKVMVSTVASRNMAKVVGTKDITMIHSVVDLLGVNSISGKILDQAAAAVCGMSQSQWNPQEQVKRIALTFFGFITKAAEGIRKSLEEMGYEVIAFHANGTGGMAMEELAAEGYFAGILDLATHELADALMNGYCGGIGPERFNPIPGKELPRLIVPGGMDCAVLEFTRHSIPNEFKDRKIFFYDFRSAIRLNIDESLLLAKQLSEKLNHDAANIRMLIPSRGWSEADRETGPLYDPTISKAFIQKLMQDLDPRIDVQEINHHINDTPFAQIASRIMDEMIQAKTVQGFKVQRSKFRYS